MPNNNSTSQDDSVNLTGFYFFLAIAIIITLTIILREVLLRRRRTRWENTRRARIRQERDRQNQEFELEILQIISRRLGEYRGESGQQAGSIEGRQQEIYHGQTRQQDSTSGHTHEILSKKDIEKYFPKKTFGKMKSHFVQTTCSICLDDFQEDSVCRQLYCEHIFHGECIGLWLDKYESCPNCQKSMKKSDIEEFLRDQTQRKEAKPIDIKENSKDDIKIQIDDEMPQWVVNKEASWAI